ncbi:MAG: hypothetical protein Q7J29_03375 [Stagnimonas sp.]|nr:hypothetical protein [Stagnimonas sp.]
MSRTLPSFCLLYGLMLAGCATPPMQQSTLDAAGAPFAFTVTPQALRDQPSLLQAQVSGSEVLGLFNVSSHYDVQQADRQQDARAIGIQSLAQSFQTAVPLPQGSALQLDVSNHLEQRLSQDGLLAAQRRALNARWNDGDLRFALNASASTDASSAGCGLDASLTAPLPNALRSVTADASDLRVNGQLCQRTLASGVPQKAQILTAETAWDDDFGARGIRVSRIAVRDLATGEDAAGTGSSGFELGAQHAIELGGWAFSQGVTVRQANGAQQAGGWAARSQLSHRVYRVPVTASWQRHDAAVWSLGSLQQAASETSLGFDLSAPLQHWLSQNAGAKLSYHRIDPADKKAALDEQIRLGVSVGW